MRRRRQEPARRTCLTAGCGMSIPGWKLLCGTCLSRLPWPRRRQLLDAPRHLKFAEAQAAVAWLGDHSPAAEAARRQGERLDEEPSGGRSLAVAGDQREARDG